VTTLSTLQWLPDGGYRVAAHTFAPKAGVWAFFGAAQTDVALLFGGVCLLRASGDRWPPDVRLQRR
jgi:hypothetical protein